MNKLKLLSVLVGGLALTGCASIFSKSNYPVTINSSPTGVEFTVFNKIGQVVTAGITPQSVNLKASSSFFSGETYRIVFKSKKFGKKEFILDSSIDGWYFANFFIGGLIGLLIIDPATGAMFKLPEQVNVGLGGIDTHDKNSLNIISKDVLTAEQQSKLIPIKL